MKTNMLTYQVSVAELCATCVGDELHSLQHLPSWLGVTDVCLSGTGVHFIWV